MKYLAAGLMYVIFLVITLFFTLFYCIGRYLLYPIWHFQLYRGQEGGLSSFEEDVVSMWEILKLKKVD